MLSTRNPLKDQVAIIGLGASPYGRHIGRSPLDLGLEAARNAIIDAGIDKEMIDGICGSGMNVMQTHHAGVLSLQGALGIPELNWMINGWLGSQLVYTTQAVFSGACDFALIVQSEVRGTWASTSAANDPFRLRRSQMSGGGGGSGDDYASAWIHSGEPYAAWANKYMHDYGAPKEMLGLIAINNRQWASKNPAAVMRTPITMDDYMASRMIREPLGVLDLDLPVDGAEAMVLTTAERAKDFTDTPVYVHAATLGGAPIAEYYDNIADWTETAPWIAMKGLWPRSDLTVNDMDLFFPYDGYTPIAIAYIEAAGFCGPGESWGLLQDSWNEESSTLMLSGRTAVSTNGGSLSHGRLGGFNYYTEGVHQLRGTAGERQLQNPKAALFGVGSFHHDPAAVVLRAD